MSEMVPFEFHRPQTRASDTERQAIVEVLQRHYAEGRLDLADFEARSETALASRTQGELVPLIADLPSLTVRPHTSGPPVRPHDSGAAFHAYLRVWIALSVMFVLIWVLTGADYYFWPVWPIFGTGIPVLLGAAFRGTSRDN
jgi:hypothetical protein